MSTNPLPNRLRRLGGALVAFAAIAVLLLATTTHSQHESTYWLACLLGAMGLFCLCMRD